jgi:hypothetical protein
MRRMVVLIGAMGLAAGCAHQEGLLPAPQAKVMPGSPKLAYDERSGVEVLVNGDAWKSNPSDLGKVMTPVGVTVRNRGQSPIRIAYQDFALETPSGARLNPLPPYSMRTLGPARAAVVSPMLDYGFYDPWFYGPYSSLGSWWGHFPYDAGFYDGGIAQWRVQLPTEEMLRAALPEGVIEPGGSVTGFLFFPDIPAKAQGVFTLRATFPEESGRQLLAKVDIPLVTTK